MSAPLPDTADPTDAWARAVLQGRAEALGRLAEMGLELAGAIRDRALAADAPAEAALPFSRVAKAVRMSCLLQARLVEQVRHVGKPAPDYGALAQMLEGAGVRGREDLAGPGAAHAHRTRVETIVERAARDCLGDDEDRLDQLVDDMGERLDDDTRYGPVLDRPVGELVALVCRDLGLDPDWGAMAGEAWAVAEVERAGGRVGLAEVMARHLQPPSQAPQSQAPPSQAMTPGRPSPTPGARALHAASP